LNFSGFIKHAFYFTLIFNRLLLIADEKEKAAPKPPLQVPEPPKESAQPKTVPWQPWPTLTDYPAYPATWVGFSSNPTHNPLLLSQQSLFFPREAGHSRQPDLDVPLNLVQREYLYADHVFDMSKYFGREKE
jgi:hypothetical protein